MRGVLAVSCFHAGLSNAIPEAPEATQRTRRILMFFKALKAFEELLNTQIGGTENCPQSSRFDDAVSRDSQGTIPFDQLYVTPPL